MAQNKGVIVQKLQGQLGLSNAGTDNHIAFIHSGIPVGTIATAVNNAGKGVVLKSPYDAEVLGINQSFDDNNDITLYAEIVEFFRLAPEATLYLFNSVVIADIKAFINQNKDIKGYGLNFIFDSEVPNLESEISKHQTIIDDFAAENRLIDFAILGPDELDDFTLELFTLEAPNVSVFVGCETNSKRVAITSILGMIAVRAINENVGSIDIQKKPAAKKGNSDYPLTDTKRNKWVNAYLSDGRAILSVGTPEFTSLKSKGYIAAVSYEGYEGFFIDNSYTCVERASDFLQIENNRVWNKAARIIRTTLLPKVKGVVKKDPTTGFIKSTTVGSWTALLNKALEGMVKDDEISGYSVFIDNRQIVSSTESVKVQASVVKDGIVHEFEVAIGLTNNI